MQHFDLEFAGGHRCLVAIAAGLDELFGSKQVQAALGDRRVAILADRKVAALHGDAARAGLARAGRQCVGTVLLPAGEAAKRMEVAASVLEEIASLGLERRDLIVSLGGGAAGDLAGLVAALYQRGIAVAHLPSTLLAQVDAAIGGKTAVNLQAGKNLAGAFHQPCAVLAATDLLLTLPDREFRSGLAEAVKTALLFDENLLLWIEARAPRQAADLQSAERVELVMRCARHKGRVVTEDERESGTRRMLNLGHTLAHALETVAAASGVDLHHGEAVAIGLVFASRLAEAIGVAGVGLANRIEKLLLRIGLPIAIPEALAQSEIERAMLIDKKRERGRTVWILPLAPGQAEITDGLDPARVAAILAEWRRSP